MPRNQTEKRKKKKKTITDHRQTMNNATRYARLKIQSEDHTGNNYNSLTATWLQQFDGNMVTTVWRQHGYTVTRLQQLTATKEQDCNSLASWTGRIHMVFNWNHRGNNLRAGCNIYAPRSRNKTCLNWALTKVRCVEVVMVTQLNKSSWIRGGGVRPTHFPPRGPMWRGVVPHVVLCDTCTVNDRKW